MSFCSYSSSTHSGTFIVLENTFINDYLPYAPDLCVKVYLYGLSLCNNVNSIENSFENICHVLNISAVELKDIFDYWQGEGLVQIIENNIKDNLEIKYLPVTKRVGSSKIRKDKYSEFNSNIQAVISERMITPTEYNEYYTLIESMHLTADALIEIANYCVKLKGGKVGYPYIITVAKSFIEEGLLTAEKVKEKLDEHQEIIPELAEITKAFGKTLATSLDDRNKYIKWTKEYGFSHATIKEVAKSIKTKSPSIPLLDTILTDYFNRNLITIKEIKVYNENRERYNKLAKEIASTIGVRYDVYDSIVEHYLLEWFNKGYSEESLKKIAHHCLSVGIKAFPGMGQFIDNLFSQGIVSDSAIDHILQGLVERDNHIKEILSTIKLDRLVTTDDRRNYNCWTNDWGFSQEIILLVAGACKTIFTPIKAMNQTLSSLYENKIFTPQEVKKFLKNNPPANGFTQIKFKEKAKDSYIPSTTRSYEGMDLESAFDDLDSIEI